MNKDIFKSKKKETYDVVIVGAGPSGCVLAEQFASKKKYKILILEKRNHVAGNCFDELNSKKILIHKYGPHYLRFKKKRIFNYLSKFTKWIKGNYQVKTYVDKKLFPFPVNLTTIEKFFNKKFKNVYEAKKFIEKKKIKIKKPKNSEELILSKLGREMYEKFYKNYTLKQWNIHPSKLDKFVTGRIPIRFNRNKYYVNEKLQYMPKNGYTEMFKKMINNPLITIKLNKDFIKFRDKLIFNKYLIYCGTPDSYFNFKLGRLKWRSLKFKFKNYKKEYIQKCVQYNFPNDFNYTRKVEIKHVTKQKSPYTTISEEYPMSKGDPYYPIPDKKNKKIFKKYSNLISNLKKKNIYFTGRLATYRYLNTDQVIEQALNLYKDITGKHN